MQRRRHVAFGERELGAHDARLEARTVERQRLVEGVARPRSVTQSRRQQAGGGPGAVVARVEVNGAPERLAGGGRILGRGKNSELLYAALEIRFALERLADRELLMASKATNRSLHEYDPVKKVASLRRLDAESADSFDVVVVTRESGDDAILGQYMPLDKDRTNSIKGRLGDLLHPKRGLRLGIPNDPWYLETRKFLHETLEYLSPMARKSLPFFAFEGLEHVELRRPEQ